MRVTAAWSAMAALLLAVGLAAYPLAAQEREAGSYLIREGDVLQITVWKNQDLSQTVVVRPDGMISMPLVNDVKVSGSTPEAVRQDIASRLAAFVNAPSVSVIVNQVNSYRVYSLGAVTTNGMFQLNGPMTAVQLLALAGGPSPEADLSRASLIRGRERIPVNLDQQVKEGEDLAQRLMPGDVLMVPHRRADVQRILMAGEVRTPQSITYREGMTAIDAFLAAGGGTDSADLKNIRVSRVKPGGETVELTVDLESVIKTGSLSGNLPLVPGDTVIVPFRKVDVQRILVVGQVRTPRSMPFREGTTVLDAFVEAGGGTDYADLNGAKVMRHVAGGKQEEIPVNLGRILKKGDLGANITLLPGDILVVP